jgi:tetratricopeptide (TPR) repeat protein
MMMLSLLTISTTFANVGPVFIAGKQIEANNATHVVLERETIDVILSPMSAHVVCNFYLKNTGATETLTLGFPGKDEDEGDMQNRTMKDFVVMMNDAEVETSYQQDFDRTSPEHPYRDFGRYGWYLWENTFQAGEYTHIKISYTALNHNFGFTYNPYGDFVYILATGSLWKDSIHSIDIVVRFADMDICQITDYHPQHGRVNLDKLLTWHFEDIEPDWESNIAIWYEIELFAPGFRVGAEWGLDELDGDTLKQLLLQENFETIQERIERSEIVREKAETDPNDEWDYPSLQTIQEIALRNIADEILAVGTIWQKHEQWEEAITLYQWCKETYGDIRSDLRPYSILYLRLAECYRGMGNTARAIAFFQASMDTEPMTKERYFRGLQHMFYVEAERVQNDAPFRSKKSTRWKHYFYSKGLNEYCRINLDALGGHE